MTGARLLSTLTHLACSECARTFDPALPHGLCPDCARPLLARYDLPAAARTLTLEVARRREAGFGAYTEVLPFRDPPLTLGEARAPLIRARRLDAAARGAAVWIRDEGIAPTGSFKSRGLAVAVQRAAELGLPGVALPTAGNAGMALAAYAAAHGLTAVVVCPSDTPAPFVTGARLLGARVELHPGLIDACGARAGEICRDEGLFDCSTLKEPYRVEGKKTMGYDMVRDLDRIPDVVVYPTGGGTGIVGIWKAFSEMEGLGWIGRQRPRLVSVQAEGCAPIVRAFEAGDDEAAPWENASTLASGLRVPRAVGDRLVLDALRASGGAALAVSDPEMIEGAHELGRATGVLAAPEGGACLAATRRLADAGEIGRGQSVVIMNTGSALAYAAAY